MGEQVVEAPPAATPDRAAVAALARRLYAGVPGWRGWAARRRPAVCPLDAVLAWLPPGGRVLDVGCGNGLLLALAASTGRCAEGVGVDVDGGAVAVARAAAAANGLTGLSFVVERIAEGGPRRSASRREDAGARAEPALSGGGQRSGPPPAAEDGFEAVALVDVLHHVAPAEREATVRAAAGCVAAGGVLVVKDMVRRPRWRAFANWCHDLVLARQSVRHVDPDTVEGWAVGAGLQCEHAARIDRLWYGHWLRVFGRPPRPTAHAAPEAASLGLQPPASRLQPPPWLALLRPRQWAKNLLVLAALLFSGQVASLGAVGAALWALAAFVLASGAVYAWNDAADAAWDRRHPEKRHRPVAAGRLSPSAARAIAGGAAASALGAAAWLPWPFAGLLGLFLLLHAGYSAWWKAVPLLDVGCVASGFVLRAAAGAVAIGVVASPWLLTCTTFLALFLALAKRRQELAGPGAEGRPALAGYTVALCDQLITVAVAGTLVTYALYCVLVHGPWFLLTGAFVLAGVGRYCWLIHTRGAGAAPEDVLLADRPLWAILAAWVAACAALV